MVIGITFGAAGVAVVELVSDDVSGSGASPVSSGSMIDLATSLLTWVPLWI